MKNEDQWFLKGFEDNTSWGNSSQISRHFKTEERSKRDKNYKIRIVATVSCPLCVIMCAYARV